MVKHYCFSEKKEQRINPGEDHDQFNQQNINRVFLIHMGQFVLQDLFFYDSLFVFLLVDKNIIQKTVWKHIVFCQDKCCPMIGAFFVTGY